MHTLPPETLLRRLDLAVRRRMEGTAAGEQRAFGVRGGMEIDRIRPWAPGDEWRHLDAAATARTAIPHVRVPVAERRLTLWLGIDTSSSMAFGTRTLEKADLATAVGTVFGLVALRQAARVGMMPLVDGTDRPMPPRTGRAGLLDMIERLAIERESARSDLGAALDRFDVVVRERATVVVVSDFRDLDTERWRRPLVRLGSRHELVCVEIRDPRELSLPDVGVVTFTDPESGRMFTLDTSNRKIRERFASRAAVHAERIAEAVMAAHADHMIVSTGDDWLTQLMHQMEARRRRRWASPTR
ncbi:MAG: DUF58 domain-containing protein [Acidimicrobiia bacterium]|nr:DUF58 domain-containing protein [Acidimicrobiia bacterium]